MVFHIFRQHKFLLYYLLESKIKYRSFPDGAFHPDSSSMAGNDPFYRRQPYAGSRVLLNLVKTRKREENLIRIGRNRKTATVIPDEKNGVFGIPDDSKLDLGRSQFFRILPGIT